MKIKTLYLLSLILVFNCQNYAQEPDWFRKIKSIDVLISTRKDIIKLFEEPKNSNYPYFESYQLKEGKMNVEYSKGFCNGEKKDAWNVTEFTVTRIFFTPNRPVTPEMLGINPTEFHKYEIEDVPGAFEYENDETGIDFTLKTTGKIEIIVFNPQKKYDNLYCNR